MTSDEEITAFLDGALPPAEQAALAQRIATDSALADKVAALELDQSAIATAFDGLAAMAPPYKAPPSAKAPPRRWAALAIAASIILAFAGGFALSNRSPLQDWRMEVAHYQMLYVPETLAHIAPEPTRIALEFTRASRQLGHPLDPEALANISGLTLRRAQVLGYLDQPLIQIAYTEADGTPIAFCIIANTSGESEAIEGANLLGLASATWQDGQNRYLVIGGSNTARIMRYATQIREKINVL